eukprot:TRINITY_DN33631_c0_g1_i1.p1 TRINITY_DN33631_c0_g1~~TRINITY_DN33631_c0_g1_i1.p1  ORF type:complete len:679 (+),score=102.32 TRINITY_DN33631_c0_g1_i1:73-2109(+)
MRCGRSGLALAIAWGFRACAAVVVCDPSGGTHTAPLVLRFSSPAAAGPSGNGSLLLSLSSSNGAEERSRLAAPPWELVLPAGNYSVRAAEMPENVWSGPWLLRAVSQCGAVAFSPAPTAAVISPAGGGARSIVRRGPGYSGYVRVRVAAPETPGAAGESTVRAAVTAGLGIKVLTQTLPVPIAAQPPPLQSFRRVGSDGIELTRDAYVHSYCEGGGTTPGEVSSVWYEVRAPLLTPGSVAGAACGVAALLMWYVRLWIGRAQQARAMLGERANSPPPYGDFDRAAWGFAYLVEPCDLALGAVFLIKHTFQLGVDQWLSNVFVVAFIWAALAIALRSLCSSGLWQCCCGSSDDADQEEATPLPAAHTMVVVNAVAVFVADHEDLVRSHRHRIKTVALCRVATLVQLILVSIWHAWYAHRIDGYSVAALLLSESLFAISLPLLAAEAAHLYRGDVTEMDLAKPVGVSTGSPYAGPRSPQSPSPRRSRRSRSPRRSPVGGSPICPTCGSPPRRPPGSPAAAPASPPRKPVRRAPRPAPLEVASAALALTPRSGGRGSTLASALAAGRGARRPSPWVLPGKGPVLAAPPPAPAPPADPAELRGQMLLAAEVECLLDLKRARERGAAEAEELELLERWHRAAVLSEAAGAGEAAPAAHPPGSAALPRAPTPPLAGASPAGTLD